MQSALKEIPNLTITAGTPACPLHDCHHCYASHYALCHQQVYRINAMRFYGVHCLSVLMLACDGSNDVGSAEDLEVDYSTNTITGVILGKQIRRARVALIRVVQVTPVSENESLHSTHCTSFCVL